ncbi:MAG: class I SAM-dependent methyltransferase [Desulfobacterales bacterium]|nr:class I SAM-dependent methyltransferase [Desulfobacterales bacterium]
MMIQKLFDQGAADYDAHRQKVIPCFRDFYGTLVDCIPYPRDRRFSFLDLGAGTGLVSALIRSTFPQSRGSLVDLSQGMLKQAENRFKDDPLVNFHSLDYAHALPGGKFDLVVSALSIHHLSHPDKETLFQMIFNQLTPGGIFIHGDLILGQTPAITRCNQEKWKNHIRSTGMAGDALEQIWDRMAQDNPAPLALQLNWMKGAGFQEVDSFYQYRNFAVYSGTKPN